MKKTVGLFVKVIFLVLLITWMILFVTDYFRAKDGKKPMICLSEQTKELNAGTYYKCDSFGYKYYEYRENNQLTYGFGAIFFQSDLEKELGV